MKIYKVTDEGIEEIRQFMLANHKRPDEATTERALANWAADAEQFADINERAIVEIPEADSIHGQAVAIELEGSCLEMFELDDQRC
ncbi:MAG: hypothetical protein VB032_05670 [Burkholderiaceae bacterium]|nr:hypothetical protein [Burkholderiaceae bacterium]